MFLNAREGNTLRCEDYIKFRLQWPLKLNSVYSFCAVTTAKVELTGCDLKSVLASGLEARCRTLYIKSFCL